jgi:endonuclease YncB( thermonuclease family)
MHGWIRAGSIALAGFGLGLAVGYCLWRDPGPGERGFERRYAEGARVLVKSVLDGDTIQLEDGMHVRYRGCDTPEVYRFTRDPKPMSERASARNRELVEGVRVRLRFPPPGRPPIDGHGRLLADVYLDTDEPLGEVAARGEVGSTTLSPPRGAVAETLIREGLARLNPYEMDGEELRRLRAAEAEAREAGRGIWSEDASEGGDAPFVASRYGKYVHRADCEYAQRINPKNLMKFYTLEAALATGRGRCPGCLGRKPRARRGGKKSRDAPRD